MHNRNSLATLILMLSAMAAQLAHANEALMEKSGCISCHRVDQRLIGPPFKEVAARYRGRDVLAALQQKVREGGEGEWGDIPMAANSPEKISDDNLKVVLEWILSL